MMVLNDGETYTGLEGCKIVKVPSYVEDDNIDSFVKLAGDADAFESHAVVRRFGSQPTEGDEST